MARDPSYLPSASDLREICLPIANVKDQSVARDVLERVEAQRTALLDVTGTVDRFRLDLEISRASTALGLTTHDDALSELYVRASDLENDGSKLDCLSWMRASLDEFRNTPPSVDTEFRSLCDWAIQETTEKCLATTAEHLAIFKGAMLALVESNPEAVLDLVEKLNTEDRRDSAYAFFVERLVSRRSVDPVPIRLLQKGLGSIIQDEVRWKATVTCLRLLAQRMPLLDDSPSPLIALGSTIEDPLGKAFSWRWIVIIANHYAVALDLEDATSQFKMAVGQVDEVWRVPELYYWFIESLAKVNRDFANLKLDEYESQSLSRRGISPSYSRLLSSLARLSIVSFAGILQQRIDTDDELNSLLAVIDVVPSAVMQMELYTDLALRAYAKNRRDVFDKVCEQQMAKIIDSSGSAPIYLKQKLAAISYVALFLWNQQYADATIAELPSTKQDDCRQEIIWFFVIGNTTYEPYQDQLFRGSRLTYATSKIIVSLIEKMSVDSCLANSIVIFANAITTKRSMNEITSHQRAELALCLTKKVERDLPDLNNIKHDGWKILAQAFCLKLTAEVNSEKWKRIIENAKAIPNTSDSVYVLTSISECLPKKMASEKAAVLSEAESRLKLIPSVIDRVRRQIAISNATLSSATENAIAKRMLTTAMADSLSLRDLDAASEVQKQIIDMACQIDSDFAVELTKMIDDDPARVRARTEAKSRLEDQRNKLAMADRRYSDVDDEISNMGEIAWDMLGSLNAGKMAPQKQEELAPLLKAASRRSLVDVLGFYWWYLRNLQGKYETKPHQSRTILLPLFELTRLAALLAEKIGGRVCGSAQRFGSFSDSAVSASFIATPGVREDALAYIKRWIEPLQDQEVLICDPYFKIDDIEFIKILSFYKDGLSFTVLTCAPDGSSIGDLDSEYRAAWSKIAYVEPPPMRVVHVTYEGTKRNDHPIHDRWLFCGSAALRVGTSVGSLGVSKLSEISTVNTGDVSVLRAALDPFIQMRERWIDGQRLRYRVVQW